MITKKQVVIDRSWGTKKGFSSKPVGVVSFKDGATDKQKKSIVKERQLRHLDAGRFKNNEVLEKTIHSYRMWFSFLKLALFLEEQKTTLIMKHKIKRKEWVLVSAIKIYQDVEYPEITQKIKVKRSRYKGWDLNEVRDKSFNEWWDTHSHLFSEQICKELDDRDTISQDERHLTLEIDTSLKLTDIVKTITRLIKERRKANKDIKFDKQRKYSVVGSIHKDALTNKYNALILKLENNLSNEEILTHKDGYIRTKYKISEDKDFYKNYSRVVYGLLDSNGESIGAKQILVNVCEGHFLKSEINRERRWKKTSQMDSEFVDMRKDTRYLEGSASRDS